jgi:DNA-binding MarR family transcriptional regulator
MPEDTKRVGSECLGFRARLLSRIVTSVYDECLSAVGLKVSQFSVLNAVASGEDALPAELAKFLDMDESTLSRNVARMCAKGWLRLEPGEDDRRSHQIRLTDLGKALLSRLATSAGPSSSQTRAGRRRCSEISCTEAAPAELMTPEQFACFNQALSTESHRPENPGAQKECPDESLARTASSSTS